MSAAPIPPREPRIPPLQAAERSAEQQEALAKTLLAPGSQPLNIFATLARHPDLMKRVNVLGGHFMTRNVLPDRERELVILRVAVLTRCRYEFGQHTGIAAGCGVTPAEITRLTEPLEQGGWSAGDLALLRMVDELIDHDAVTPDTWDAVAGRWDDPQVIEILLLVGFYRMLAGFLNAVGVPPEDDLPGWPQ